MNNLYTAFGRLAGVGRSVLFMGLLLLALLAVARPAQAQVPPGNALAFDGSDDYVAFGSTPAVNNLGPGSFTMEAWVYYDGGSGPESIIRKDGDYNFYLNGNKLHAEVWSSGTGSPTWQRIDGTTTLPANRWAHVAAVWNGSTMQLYVNGVAEASTVTTSSISASANLTLGKSQVYGNLLSGRLDEVRIYTAALTPANIQADMRSTTSAVPASLKFYANFDQGTAGGSNPGQTTLPDQTANTAAGTLTNFDLSSGNTTSNWVESYALVVPTLTAATGSTATGFTANWTAPAVGTVDNGYFLEVATSNTFAAAALVVGSPFTTAGTSYPVSGLDPTQTYYYRVRADKTSVTGQGAYSTTGIRRPATLLVPPGNALAFDGSDDYVALPAAAFPANFTFEAWVNYQDNGIFTRIFDFGTGTNTWMILGPRSGYGFNSGNIFFGIVANRSAGAEENILTTTPMPTGWHHVAVTLATSGATTSGTLYLDGNIIGTNAALTASPASLGTLTNNWLGRSQYSDPYFKGRLDEVRLYSTALTPAQVQADMTSTSAAVPASLLAYYNFDQGTAGGANAAYTTLADQTASAADGTLLNFSLSSGNTTSNWVESYALLQPTGLVVSARTPTSFLASWTAPTINGAAPAAGIVEGYVLDVSTSSTFASGVTSFPVTGYSTTSQAVTGLANGTTYYLRVRAEKASVTGQGDYSPSISTHTVGTDAQLASLVPSTGVLSPAFAPATLAYTLYVAAGTPTYTLTPTASNGYTSITINGAAVASGTASASLSVGGTATVVLTSEDGNTTATYTVQAVVAPGYFRSVATGNWGSPATWESSADNVSWTAAPVAPLYQFLPTVNVRNTHTVTLATAESLKTVTIESGGVLTTVAGQTLTVPSGAAVTVAAGGVLSIGQLTGVTSGSSSSYGTLSLAGTLTVNGTLVLNTNSTPATSMGFTASTAVFGAGSRLVLFATTAAPVIPVAAWDAAATLELAGAVASTVPNGLNGKTLGSLEVNLTGSGIHALLGSTGTATLTGNLTVTNTGTTGTLRLLTLATTIGGALTINGSYVQNGGTVVGCSANNVNATGNATVAVNVGGSFTVAGGSFTANQGYTTTTSTIRPNPLTIGGNLTVRAGATFSLVSGLSAFNGTSVASTAFLTSRVNLLGNFINEGTLTTGSTVAANTGQQLYFAKTGVQAFASSGTIGTATNRVNATVNSGSTLDLGTSAFTGTGTFTALSGATLRLGSPAGISPSGTATGNVQNTGTRTFAGNVEFGGPAAQVTGTGFPATLAATTTLIFNNPAGVTLSQATAVPGTLRLQQGAATSTATNLLVLGTGTGVPGTLDATTGNAGVIVGPFKRWIPAAIGARTFPVGTPTQLRPATIDFTAAPSTAGSLTAEFIVLPSGNQGLPLTEGSITVNKASASGYWRVAAADGLAGGTYTPTFTFTGASGVLDYTQLVLLKRADPSADWALVGTHVTTTGSNAAPVLSRLGVAGFSDFTAGGDFNVNPLPVELAAFTATAAGPAVRLAWATASEKNSARFEVERSTDGREFERLGMVAASGSSSSARAYGYLDNQVPKTPSPQALLYYRLKQVDLDGSFSYSPVRTVALTAKAEAGLALYPNPAHGGAATLTGARPGTLVTAFDTLGRPVASASADALGTAVLALPAGLPTGVYLVRAGSKALRLTVE
ncbi:MAG: fibronectin type III domain-containing protein [Bacteroidota bacterium]|nr:fibronectin type III domain-containing protein [Bacteroidota bacterium]